LFRIYDGRNQFYQWDIDRKLIVEDKTINEVHFCNKTGDCSLVCEVYEYQGLRLADVPNVLLQTDWRINVYGYDIDHTKFCEVFDVIKRSRPADYVYTDEDIRFWEELEARIDQIEENGVSDERIGEAVNAYLEENPIEVDLTGLATEKYVDDAIAAIPEVDLSDYAKKTDIPSTSGLATESYVDEKFNSIEIPDVDLTGYATEEFVKKEIAQAQIGGEGGDVDLSNYYTKSEVDTKIENVELTPGPTGKDGADGKDGYTPVKGVDYFDGAPGKDGADGKDYVLTEADKEEIAGMVDVSGADVDLSDYYTKEEINELLANLPEVGEVLPAAEEVGF
jgi:hypothetical protein